MSPTEQLPVLEGRGRSCPPSPSALCMLSLCPPSAHTQIADKLRFVLSFKDCLLFTGCGVTSPPSHATTGPTLRMAPPPPKLVAWAGGCTPLLLQQWEWGAAGRSPHCWCWGGPCGWARYDDVVGISLRVDCAVGGSDTGSPLCSPCPFGGGGLWAVPHRTPPPQLPPEVNQGVKLHPRNTFWFCFERAVPPPINWTLIPRGSSGGASIPASPHAPPPSGTQPPHAILLCSHRCPQPSPGCAIAPGSKGTQR